MARLISTNITCPYRMKIGHSWKSRCKKNLGTTWVRGVVQCTCYGSLQVSPDIFELKKSCKGWGCSIFLTSSHQNTINVFSWSHPTGCRIFNRSTTTSNPEAPFAKIGKTKLKDLRQLETLFQYHLNKPGTPARVEQTLREPALPRIERRINAPAPRVDTHQKPAPRIPSANTTSYRSRDKKANIIPQEEMKFLANFTET